MRRLARERGDEGVRRRHRVRSLGRRAPGRQGVR
jgi:hypothetical protein